MRWTSDTYPRAAGPGGLRELRARPDAHLIAVTRLGYSDYRVTFHPTRVALLRYCEHPARFPLIRGRA